MKTAELKTLINEWIKTLEEKEKSKNTLDQYRLSLNKLLQYFENDKVYEINKKNIIGFKKYLEENYKTSTVNTRLSVLNKFFKDNDLDNYSVELLNQQQTYSNDNMITEGEYRKIIKACDRKGKERTKQIINTLVATGVRYAELSYITVESLTEQKGIIKVWNKGKERTITIPKAMIKELLKYCENNGIESGIIFHGRSKDKLISKAQLWKDIQYVAGQARVKKSKVHAHSFRHLFAKRAINAGTALTDLADLLGHKSVETTRIYTQKTSKEQQKTVDGLFSQYSF